MGDRPAAAAAARKGEEGKIRCLEALSCSGRRDGGGKKGGLN